MSLANQIQTWSIGRNTAHLQAEIKDELNFHVQCRVDELVESGLCVSEASEMANQEFGDRASYAKDCHQVQIGRQLWLSRIMLGAVLTSVLAVVGMAWALYASNMENGKLAYQLQASLAAIPFGSGNGIAFQYDKDFTGTIVDGQDKPIPNAKILLLHKSWPGGYMQRAYETTTDENGKFEFENQYSSSMQNAFLVTVFIDGYSMSSKYEEFSAGNPVPAYEFQLESNEPLTFQFVDEQGEPLANTDVYISTCKSGDNEFMTYYDSRRAATWKTDDDGQLSVSFFKPGDVVTIEVGPEVEGSIKRTFTVDKDSNEMEPQVVGAESENDLTGLIKDSDGNGVAGAKILMLHKSWSGRFAQAPFETTTDENGKYRFENQFQNEIRNAFLVTVFAEEHGMQSRYEVFEPGVSVPAFDFQLKGTNVSFVQFEDSDGQPIANAEVFVSDRKSGEDEYQVYTLSRDSATWRANENGVARLSFFEPDDIIQVEVSNGEQMQKVSFTVKESTSEMEPLVVSVDISSGTEAPKRRTPFPVANNAEHVQWIKDNAVELESIDPTNEEFADLAKLKELIGDARIVQLGEQSHGDGTCFETKVRLVKFLHQEMGFDVLAFESGLYDCDKAWEALKEGEPAIKAASQGVFGIWTGSSQTAEMWNYLSKHARGVYDQTPLELAGFDCQFTGAASTKLRRDLADLTDKLDIPGLEDEEWEKMDKTLGRLIKSEESTQSSESFLASLKKISDAVAAADSSVVSPEDAAFWKQQFRSMADNCRRKLDKAVGMDSVENRDKQMAENFVWLANERFADRKIIVWAASFHIVRNITEIEVLSGSTDYSDMVQMGSRVHDALGDQCYTIGFTAFEGRAGAYHLRKFDIAEAPEGTLESMCEAAGLENAFVPMRGTKDTASWLHEELYARPMGYGWTKAKWPKHFDAMFFNRVMSPSTR